MTGFLNYYGRNPFPSDDWTNQFDFMGYSYLGPMFIPPIVPTMGLTDRATGTVWYLMWDGETHIELTNTYPMCFPQWTTEGLSEPYPQTTTVFGPWDGPYTTNGWRLGVLNGRLQMDSPGPGQYYTEGGPPVFAPYVGGPQQQTYPEPSNYPAPGVPTIPGIPSSTPPPTGGGLQLFYASASTNTPPVLIPTQTASGEWTIEVYGI